MKVNELIERLKKCKPELNVFAGYEGDDPIKDVTSVDNLLQITLSENEEHNSVVLRLGTDF